MISGVFFDLDGTLADTAADLGDALNRLRADNGLTALPQESIRPHVSRGARGLIRLGFDIEPGHDEYARLQQRFLAYYESALCSETTLFEGVAAALDALDRAGMRWGIVTNKSSRYALPLVAALGLAERTACIVCGDSAPRAKPAPDPLLLAAALTDATPSACLYLGDDLRDIQAGRAAGMTPVAAAWGYLGDELPVDKWGAEWILESPHDLAALLSRGAC